MYGKPNLDDWNPPGGGGSTGGGSTGGGSGDDEIGGGNGGGGGPRGSVAPDRPVTGRGPLPGAPQPGTRTTFRPSPIAVLIGLGILFLLNRD